MELRLKDGRWYTLTFDVEQQESGLFTSPEGMCDGCGELWFGSERVGEDLCG